MALYLAAYSNKAPYVHVHVHSVQRQPTRIQKSAMRASFDCEMWVRGRASRGEGSQLDNLLSQLGCSAWGSQPFFSNVECKTRRDFPDMLLFSG